MKRSFASRPSFSSLSSFSLAASAALIATGLATAPVLRAQQPTPEVSASPTPGSTDIFDIIKKGADKLQKEEKEQKELAPEIKKLNDRQNDLLRRHVELERHLQSILLKQEEAIQRLDHSMQKLEKEMEECKMQAASKPEAPKPSAPLPMTEPTPKPTPATTPAASPSPTPSPAQS
jgi:TolA-binding protein